MQQAFGTWLLPSDSETTLLHRAEDLELLQPRRNCRKRVRQMCEDPERMWGLSRAITEGVESISLHEKVERRTFLK